MFEYEYEGQRFSASEVEAWAAERGMTIGEYLTKFPEVQQVEIEQPDAQSLGKLTDISLLDANEMSGDGASSSDAPSLDLHFGLKTKDPETGEYKLKKSFFDIQEEEVIGQLRALYGDDFEYEEVTPGADQIKITAPNGESEIIDFGIADKYKWQRRGIGIVEGVGRVISGKTIYDVDEREIKMLDEAKERQNQAYQENYDKLTNFINKHYTEDGVIAARANAYKTFGDAMESIEPTLQEKQEKIEEFDNININQKNQTKKWGGLVDIKPLEEFTYQKEIDAAKKQLAEAGIEITQKNIQSLVSKNMYRDWYSKTLEDGLERFADEAGEGDMLPGTELAYKGEIEDIPGIISIGSDIFDKDYAYKLEKNKQMETALFNSDEVNRFKDVQDKLDDPTHVFDTEGVESITLQDGRKMPVALYNQYRADYKQIEAYFQLYEKSNKELALREDLFLQTDNIQDLMRRDYDWHRQFGSRIGGGFERFAVNIRYAGAEPGTEKLRLYNEATERLNKQAGRFRKDISLEEAFENPLNFGNFFMQEAGNQIPVFATLAVPYAGWGVLLGSGFGEEWNRLSNEEQASVSGQDVPVDYSNWEKLLRASAYSGSEFVFEKITTVPLLRGARKMLGASLRSVGKRAASKEILKKQFKEGLTLAGLGFVGEPIAEGATQVTQNLIQGRPTWENVDHAMFSGFLLGGTISSMPLLSGIGTRYFNDIDKTKKITELTGKKDKLILQNRLYEKALKRIKEKGYTNEQVGGKIKKFVEKIKENKKSIDGYVKEIAAEQAAVDKNIGSVAKSALGHYNKLFNAQESIKAKLRDIFDGNTLFASQQEKEAAIQALNNEFNLLEAKRRIYLKDLSNKWSAFKANPLNVLKVNSYNKKAKDLLMKTAVDKKEPKQEEIDKQAKILYNIDAINKRIAQYKKSGLAENFTAFQTAEEAANALDKLVEEGQFTEAQVSKLKESILKGETEGFDSDIFIKAFGGSVVVVENMAKNDKIETIAHELSHRILNSAIKNNPQAFDQLADALIKHAEVNDTRLYNNLIFRVERDRKGQMKSKEVLAVFFEEVAAGRAKLPSSQKGFAGIFGYMAEDILGKQFGVDLDMNGEIEAIDMLFSFAKKLAKGDKNYTLDVAVTGVQKRLFRKAKGIKGMQFEKQSDRIEALPKRYRNIIAPNGIDFSKTPTSVLGLSFDEIKKLTPEEYVNRLGELYTRADWETKKDPMLAEMFNPNNPHSLDSLLGSKITTDMRALPGFSDTDFISSMYAEMLPHIMNFNPWKVFNTELETAGFTQDQIDDMTLADIREALGEDIVKPQYGLSGWINSQIINKRTAVLRKREATSDEYTRDLDEITETEDTYGAYDEYIEEEDEFTSFEDQNILAQNLRDFRRGEKEGAYSVIGQSEFRKLLDYKGNKGLTESVQREIKEGILEILSTNENFLSLSFEDAFKELRAEYRKRLFPILYNVMGDTKIKAGQSTSDYQNFLADNVETIIDYLSVSNLTQMQKGKAAKILVEPVMKLTKQSTLRRAKQEGLIADRVKEGTSPMLYKKLDQNVEEFLDMFLPPLQSAKKKLVDQWNNMSEAQQLAYADKLKLDLYRAKVNYTVKKDNTRGERKKALAQAIIEELAFDATMEVMRSKEFAALRDSKGYPTEIRAELEQIAREIERDVDIDFSITSVNAAIELLGNNNNDISKFATKTKNRWVVNDDAFKNLQTVLNEEEISETKTLISNLTLGWEAERLVGQELVRESIKEAVRLNQLKKDELFNKLRGQGKTRKQAAKEVKERFKNVAVSLSKGYEQYQINKFKTAIEKIVGTKVDVTQIATEVAGAADIQFALKEGKDKGFYSIEVKMTDARGVQKVAKFNTDTDGIQIFGKSVINIVEDEQTKVKLGNVNREFKNKLNLVNEILEQGGFKPIINNNSANISYEAFYYLNEELSKIARKPSLKRFSIKKVGFVKQILGYTEKNVDINYFAALYGLKGNPSGSIIHGGKAFAMTTGNESVDKLTAKIASDAGMPYIQGATDVQLRFDVRFNDDDVKLFWTVVPILKARNITNFDQGLNAMDQATINKIGESINKNLLIDRSTTAAINVQEAISMSRSITYKTKPRGMSTFDFDETLIIDGKNFITATKGEEVIKISSAQWPIEGPQLAAQGYEFDFSDFVNVRGGVDGPLLQKMKNQIEKYGPDNVFILTARPPEAATAIYGWLKTKGINIPFENITGLGNSTGEAKALWMVEKYAEGYNDMYFVDDALPNVEAVQNVFDQLDVKGKSVQARIDFSRTANQKFNDMLERRKGIPTDEVMSRAAAIRLGKNKGKFQFFVPPSAEDLIGLFYYFIGKGKQGEIDLEFLKKAIVEPFSRANTEMDAARQALIKDYAGLQKNFKEAAAALKDKIAGTNYNKEDAVRVYLWNKAGFKVPGLNEKEVKLLSDTVVMDPVLFVFASRLGQITRLKDGYIEPKDTWTAESIKSDMERIIATVRRKQFLTEWKNNVDEIFSEENLNKIEAAYGTRFRDSLEDILWRMETGTNRVKGGNRLTNAWLNWLNNSVGAIMFFNIKSAALQLISTVNYINYKDNNPLQAAKAFANQKQFWADWTMIFNSDFLKQRRSGVKTDVTTSEVASAAARATNKISGVLAMLLTKGFLPTQIADSVAIASGGATFYRNRVKTYLKQGMTQKQAEDQAFVDFRESTEESQQSARPDRISQQQASTAGRLLLSFQNYPMQQNRIIKKTVLDLANGRGDTKQHISRLLFYGVAQNLIFLSLQNALFAVLFDIDEEERQAEARKDLKTQRIFNGFLDTLLRGSGIAGGVVATAKNAILEFIEQEKRGFKGDGGEILIESANLSPSFGSKLRNIYQAYKTLKWDGEAIDQMSYFDTKNPMYQFSASILQGTTNLPASNMLRLVNNYREAFDEDNAAWQRVAVALGYDVWSIGIEFDEEIKEAASRGRKEKSKIRKKEKLTSPYRCVARTSSGTRCKNLANTKGGRCYAHD